MTQKEDESMTALAINDLMMDKALDSAAMGKVLGRGHHAAYLGSKTYYGSWNFYKKTKQFLYYTKINGCWKRKYKVDYWYKQTNYKHNSYIQYYA
jgi:hypothetical protein